MEFTVNVTWHEDEHIWLATLTSDEHSLVVDHGSFDALLERVKFIMYDVVENDLKYKGMVKLKIELDRIINMDVA